ncbi:KTSC domain-containing protein [Phenylobacterium sp.]|uniref:KTSC domain-containing protein n=1 Tax=Phenylobacterium sp. TaxID=1871053 RepID=UPI0027358523|nr:KTSC domain-containing protein [Phenylobacterium sp.]MDP3854544.1 KTSC domain-containing protein [Phenylobacterium sp.]
MQVESEAISDIRYDEERAKLFVTFHDGDAYVYVGVPGEVHRSFVDADSKGRYFAFEIRDQYPYNKLTA